MNSSLNSSMNSSLNSSMNSYGNKQTSSPRQIQNKPTNFNRQRATSSPVNPSSHLNEGQQQQQTNQYYGKKEKGIVEKLLNSYGFVECSTTGNRVFFHYSEFLGDPNHLQVGGIHLCRYFKCLTKKNFNVLFNFASLFKIAKLFSIITCCYLSVTKY